MKKTMKHILAMVIILPFLFAGCQKSETTDAEKFSNTGFYKDLPILCGEPYIANLVDTGQTYTAGILTIGNDENNLYAYFEAGEDYEIINTALYVGPAEDIPAEWINTANQTGLFDPGQFPYENFHDPRVLEFLITHDLELLDDCFAVVGIAKVKNLVLGSIHVVTAKSNLKTYGFYFDYCKQECEIPEPECETAYAYGDTYATCFLDIPAINSNNWGWTNGPISAGVYDWDIYAGAGQCDITKGTLVGTLHVDYAPPTCTVIYNIDPGFTLDETHLYVGNGQMPLDKKGNPTTAPGKFPLSGGDTFTIDGLSGDIYVVAHSVVCGDYDE